MDNSTTFRTHNSKIWLCSLLSYFMNIKRTDDNIELLRVTLCSQPNFSPYKLFHFLDKKTKEIILLNDLIKFLKEMNIPFEEKYLRIFIHNFDKDGDFCLNLSEFLGLILPKKNISLAKKISTNINSDDIDDIISSNVKNIFGKIICEELELIKNCIKTAKACKEMFGFTLYEAFILIAGNSKYICEQNLYNFLQKNNVMFNSNDMHQLMFRLDADNDGKISFEEFKEIFFPIKDDEIVYKINENNTNEKLITNYNYLKNIKEKKEQIKEKVEMNKNNNLCDFTFSKNSKISIKTKIDNAKSLKKLMNYEYDDDLIRNKENKCTNIDINNNNNNKEQSLYERTKYLIENKRPNLFNLKIPPKIKLLTQPTILCHDSEKYAPSDKKHQFEFQSNPMYIKKKNNPNISSSKIPKIVKNQRSNRYQSPKIKHTKSPLHYDYSTYSDEDGDEYFKQKKLKENKNKINHTDQRISNINEKKQCKIFGGIDYKNEVKNNFGKMVLEDEKGNKKKINDINDIDKDIKIRKFNFISNENNENDIKISNFDDIRKKNLK